MTMEKEAVSHPAPARTAREQFDRQAAHYDRQWNQWSEESLAWLLTHADPQFDDLVLDVATGTGFTALAFAPYVASVVGLDVSPGMLAQAQRQAGEQNISNVTFQEGAAEHLPFANEAFTLVTCRIAPHHFLSVPQFLGETARVLRPGGRLLLADTSVPDHAPEIGAWQNQIETWRDASHICNYTPTQWRRWVEEAGLAVQALETQDGQVRLTLNDWLHKAGCEGDAAAQVRQAFTDASPDLIAAFQITPLPDDDTAFAWQRVALCARKPVSSGAQ